MVETAPPSEQEGGKGMNQPRGMKAAERRRMNEPDRQFGRNNGNELGMRPECDDHASCAWRMMTKMEKTRIMRVAHDEMLRKQPVLSASFSLANHSRFSNIPLTPKIYFVFLYKGLADFDSFLRINDKS